MSRALLVVAALLLSGCQREERRFVEIAPAASPAQSQIKVSELQPAGGMPPIPTRNPYEGNAWAASEGQRLYNQFNCVGCHAHGGGGMGPPLIDDKWIYGNEANNIFATIVEGRPNGMPSFRGKIPEQQVWQLVTYIQSVSGQLRQDVATGREDHLSPRPPDPMMPPRDPWIKEGSPQP